MTVPYPVELAIVNCEMLAYPVFGQVPRKLGTVGQKVANHLQIYRQKSVRVGAPQLFGLLRFRLLHGRRWICWFNRYTSSCRVLLGGTGGGGGAIGGVGGAIGSGCCGGCRCAGGGEPERGGGVFCF